VSVERKVERRVGNGYVLNEARKKRQKNGSQTAT